MRIRILTGDARGRSVLRRQFAYPCAKFKARRAFLLCSGVLYGQRSVFNRAAF